MTREHDHFTITRNGRADVMLSVVECESLQETLEILNDSDAVANLRRSRQDFAAGEVFDADPVRAELEKRDNASAHQK